jgi:hypothetical protein
MDLVRRASQHARVHFCVRAAKQFILRQSREQVAARARDNIGKRRAVKHC